MNTLSDFRSRHVLALPFVLQEGIEYSFEFLDQLDLLEEFFELVDSHDSYWHYFFVAFRVLCPVFVILAIVHFIEVRIKFSEFVADVVVAEHEHLVMRPHFVESTDKIMWIFG